MKEEIAETMTKSVERIKFGSNNVCIRNDMAKKKLMFSQESCQAVMEMGNVEEIELKKFRVQCPSCLHHVFEGATIHVHVENTSDPTKS